MKMYKILSFGRAGVRITRLQICCLSFTFYFLILPFSFLLLTSLSLAQSTDATLSGTVEDAQGAVIASARVTITNPSTDFERIVTTDGSGSFTIPLLQPGTYTLLFEREGFTRVQVPNITLNVNDRKSLQIQLKVGTV